MMTAEELRAYNKDRVFGQIGYVTRDAMRTAKLWTEKLAIGPWRFVSLSDESCHDAKILVDGKLGEMEHFKFICAICNAGNMQFELIEPVYGPTIYGKFLEEHGEGLHHFKEKIATEDWEKVVNGYKERGCNVTMAGAYGNNGWAYLDTDDACIVELGDMGVNTTFPEGSELHYYPEEA